MKLPRHVMIGLVVAAVIAVGVGVLGYMHFSAPRKRTVVLNTPKRTGTIDEAAARKEVDARIATFKARGEPVLITDFNTKPIPPADNAADAYLAAIKWLDRPELNNDPVW